jgi:hypothetical protein
MRTSTRSAFLAWLALRRHNPIEPPWYGPVCPVSIFQSFHNFFRTLALVMRAGAFFRRSSSSTDPFHSRVNFISPHRAWGIKTAARKSPLKHTNQQSDRIGDASRIEAGAGR